MSVTERQITEEMVRRLFIDLEELIYILKSREEYIDRALRGLTAAQVIMAPRASNTIIVNATVPPSATLLVENTVSNLMQITFVNDDFAIPAYIGDKDVVIPAGDLLDPRQRLTYNLRRGQKKYAIIAAGTINLIVSEGESALSSVTTDAQGQGGEIVM